MLCFVQVEKCKLLIREAIKVCEDVDGTAAIPQSAYDADGCLAVSHIFCAICNGKDSLPVGYRSFCCVSMSALSK